MYYGKLCCDGCFLIGAFHSELLHNMHKIKMHFYYYQRFLLNTWTTKNVLFGSFRIYQIFFGSSCSIYKKTKGKIDLLSSFCSTDVQAYAGTMKFRPMT